MPLTNRDKLIIKDLNRFRVMDRDSIAKLHFSNIKNPVSATNTVLLRLLRDGQIQRSTSFVPYLYFGPEVQIKKNSAKINHFLAILNVYLEMKSQGDLEMFQVEPKYVPKGGGAEPDIFATYRKTNFFIEVQKTIYSEKQMNDKLSRYVDLYNVRIMADPFPHILILSDQPYVIENSYPFKVFQSTTFIDFLKLLKPEKVMKPVKMSEGIKIIVQ